MNSGSSASNCGTSTCPCPSPSGPRGSRAIRRRTSRRPMRASTSDGLVGETAGPAFTTERRGLGDLLGGFLLAWRPTTWTASQAHPRGLLPRLAQLVARGAMWTSPQDGRQAVYRLLQEREQTVSRVRVYASTARCDAGERRPYLDEIRQMASRGEDPRQVRHAREDSPSCARARGGGRRLHGRRGRNQGWPSRCSAPTRLGPRARHRLCARLRRPRHRLLEEPLDMHDWHGMAELRRRVKTPIAGGELHGAWHEFEPCSSTTASASTSPTRCSPG